MSALHIERFISLSGAGFIDLYTVPAGKLLEVKYVYLTVTYRAAQAVPYFALYATAGGIEAPFEIDTPVQIPGYAVGGYTERHGSTQLTVYASGGTKLRLWANPVTPGGSLGGGISLAGTLTP